MTLSIGRAAISRKPIIVAIGLALAGSQLAMAAEAEVENLDEITVTGSRIQQAVGMTTLTPVAALTATELQAMAPSSNCSRRPS